MNYPKLFACLMAYAVICIQGNLFDVTIFEADNFFRNSRFFCSGSAKVCYKNDSFNSHPTTLPYPHHTSWPFYGQT